MNPGYPSNSATSYNVALMHHSLAAKKSYLRHQVQTVLSKRILVSERWIHK